MLKASDSEIAFCSWAFRSKSFCARAFPLAADTSSFAAISFSRAPHTCLKLNILACREVPFSWGEGCDVCAASNAAKAASRPFSI